LIDKVVNLKVPPLLKNIKKFIKFEDGEQPRKGEEQKEESAR
jgi:hypothetical protein